MNVFFISAIVEIVLFSLVFITIIYYIIKHYSLLHFTDNFYKYKDQPSGAIAATIAGKDPREVFESSFTNKIKPVFNKFLGFLTPVFAGFTKILNLFNININSIRNLLIPIRTFFAKATGMFYTRLNNFMIGITYILQKLRTIMLKTLGGFYMVVNTMEHIRYLFQSISNSPLIPVADKLGGSVAWIGKTMHKLGLCFHPNTIVDTESGLVPISRLALGEKIGLNNYVEGIIISKMVDPYFYYKNILVTGTHLVLEDKKWMRVEDSSLKSATSLASDFQYCLITSNHTIPISNYKQTVLFRDYIENLDPHINNHVRQTILDFLNQKPSKNLYENFNWKHGFLPNTPVYLKNGSVKALRDIKIGDILLNDNEVLGIVYHKFDNYHIYNVHGIQCSEHTLLLEDEWKPVLETMYKVSVIYTPLINLITSNEVINLYSNGKEYVFRDYLETHNQEITNKVNSILQENLK